MLNTAKLLSSEMGSDAIWYERLFLYETETSGNNNALYNTPHIIWDWYVYEDFFSERIASNTELGITFHIKLE